MAATTKLQPAAEPDVPAISRLIHLAFASPPDAAAEWLKMAGLEHVRVLRGEAGAAPVSCLLRIPMGQYFGGRSVPLLGIAAVAVAPESRGRGHAKAMMAECLRQGAAEGFALSGLYASTHTLYRSVGYEHAGHRFVYTVPLSRIDVRERGGRIEALGDADDGAIKACYAAFASRFDGNLDRGAYIWSRVRKFRDQAYSGFGVREDDGSLSGMVFLNQARQPDGRYSLSLTDFSFTKAESGRRLWGLLADFEMMGHDVNFSGGPTHPALALLRQQRYKVELKDSWLIRILDVKKALEGRGYPAAVRGEVHLDLEDDLMPANNGKFVLRVEGGSGRVMPGGRGEIRATVGGLASLYTGLYTARQAALVGLVSGPDAALEAAAGVFGAGTPWMVDHF